MTTRIKLRRDTAANWLSANPILAAGEPGLETDTGKVKYGDGVTAWSAIEHTGGDALTNEGAITVQTGDADRWFVRLRREDETVNPNGTDGVVVCSTCYDSLGNAIVLARVNLATDGIVAFKFNPAGELVWKTSIGGYTNDYYPMSQAAVDSNDNIFFVMDQDDMAFVIVKLNGVDGEISFTNEINPGVSRYITSIAIDSSNKIVIGGTIYSEEFGDQIPFVAKLSATATAIEWQRILTPEAGGYAQIVSLTVDFNDDVIISGYSRVELEGNTQDHILVAKLGGGNGVITWQKTVAMEFDNYGVGYGLSTDSIGNIYVAGTYYVVNPEVTSTPGGWRKSNAVVIFKMTTNGTMVWDRRVGPGPCDWVGVSTAVGEDGDLYLYASTYQLRKDYDVTGNEGQWDNTLALARYNKTTGDVVWQSYFNNPLSQDIAGLSQNGPYGGGNPNTLDVLQDKLIIGGAVRIGPSDADQIAGSYADDYFNQGFIAQFDTDATAFAVDGWRLETSRIPGKLTNTLVATSSQLTDSPASVTTGAELTINNFAAKVSVRRSTSKTNTWTFGKDGTFTAPADTNIKLQQSQLGYATMYGVWNNNDDDIWYESVAHDSDGFAYVVGSDYWNGGKAHIQKFTPEGDVVWKRQLHSGEGASFNVTSTDASYTEVTVSSGGYNYKVGDKIVLAGSNLGGTPANSLTIEVATIDNASDGVGSVATVTIVGGLAVSTNTFSGIRDYYDDAECEVRSITFDPVTDNLVVMITTPTYNGDTLDSEWTETVVLLIDSGSGAVVSSTALADVGDVYALDVAVSSTGDLAVVGEKFNEYNEYGAITPLAGSGIDTLWVTKADIDTEHFPGEANGYIPDWWITGSSITDQVQVQDVNRYTNLTVSVQQGSGATFDVSATTGSTLATITPTDLATATVTGSTVLNSDNVVTPGGWGNWIVFPDSALRVTLEGLFTMNQVIPVNWDTGSTSLTGFVTIQFPGDGTFQITPVEEGGGAAIAGTWYFDLLFKALGSYSVTVVGGGTNYLAGHKIVVAGTSLGGTTPANDMVITVDAVDTGVITSVSNTGSPASSGTYTGVSGANYQYGSGAVMEMIFDAVTGAFGYIQNISSSGSNYVTGDKLTIAGTLFAGGASPANDIVVTVVDVSGGQVGSLSFVSGSIPATHLLIRTNASVDFAAEETFAIKQNLGGEAFIWTRDFSKAIGSNNSDKFTGVVWNAASTHLYAVGQGRYEVTYDQALVAKFAANGTVVSSVSINENGTNDGAWDGAVALMANDSIVVVHTMYNNVRDSSDEILVTKLDSDLNILWQQFLGIQSGDGSTSPSSKVSVAVDSATDEILLAWDSYEDTAFNDNAIYIVKLDTDGEVLWKNIFGTHENDVDLGRIGAGNKYLSIHGDKFTVAGFTSAVDNNNDNGMLFTLPLDGSGAGQYGMWLYKELDDTRVKPMRTTRTAAAFTPTVHTSVITATDNQTYYYTNYPDEDFSFYTQVIRSEVGGALEFADGSKQSFSTAIIPQVKINNRYTIRPEDSGRHILVEFASYNIVIPNYRSVTLPVGFTFTIVNVSNSDVYVENQSVNSGNQGSMKFSGGDDQTPYVGIRDNGSGQMVTIMKIKEGTNTDDADSHGDIWMIAGADIFNNN